MKFIIETGKTNDILRTKSASVTQAELKKYQKFAEDMVTVLYDRQ